MSAPSSVLTTTDLRAPLTARLVLGLAWPVMLARLSHTAMSLADTLFVGQLGTDALAGVGMAMVIGFIPTAAAFGLAGGLRVAVSHRQGAGDAAQVAALPWQGAWLMLPVALLAPLLTPFAGPLFAWQGAGPAVVESARAYFEVRLWSAPVEFLLVGLIAVFQGRGDTRTAMKASLLANGLNVLLDPVLIHGWGPAPALGVAGAAWATMFAQAVGFAWLAWQARPHLAAPRGPHAESIRAIARVAGPMSTQGVLEVFSWVVFNTVLVRVGAAHLAAHLIVVRIASISFLPGLALGEAASVLMGQSLGAGRPKRGRTALRLSMALALGIMVSWAALFWTLPGVFLAPFGASPEVELIALDLMRLAAVFQLFDAVAMVSFFALQGAGDSRFTMITSVASAWLIKLPLGAALALGGLGAAGAWIGLTVELVVLAALGLWRFRTRAWLNAGRKMRAAAA